MSQGTGDHRIACNTYPPRLLAWDMEDGYKSFASGFPKYINERLTFYLFLIEVLCPKT